MKEFKLYITEKLKINKDIKIGKHDLSMEICKYIDDNLVNTEFEKKILFGVDKNKKELCISLSDNKLSNKFSKLHDLVEKIIDNSDDYKDCSLFSQSAISVKNQRITNTLVISYKDIANISEKLKINKNFKDSHYKLYYILNDWCEKNLNDEYELVDEEYNKSQDTYYINLIVHGNKTNKELIDISTRIQNEIYLDKEDDIMSFLDEDTKKILVFNY